jgi:hypothetical protein
VLGRVATQRRELMDRDAYQRSAFRRPKTARPSRSIRQIQSREEAMQREPLGVSL